MTVKDLIAFLESMPSDATIEIDDGRGPSQAGHTIDLTKDESFGYYSVNICPMPIKPVRLVVRT